MALKFSQKRKQVFVRTWLANGRNGKEAAMVAGYAPSNAESAASHLLRDGYVQELLSEAALTHTATANVKAVDILRALMEIAYLDPAECFEQSVVTRPTGKNRQGERAVRMVLRLKDITELPIHVRRAISSFKVVKQNLTSGDGESDDVIEVKFWNKNEALDTLAKHLGLLTIKVEHTVTMAQMSKLSDDALVAQHEQDLEAFRKHVTARAKMRLAVAKVESHP